MPTKLVEILGETDFGSCYSTNNRASAFRHHDRYHRKVEKEIKEAETILKSKPTALESKFKTPSKLFQKSKYGTEKQVTGFLATNQ